MLVHRSAVVVVLALVAALLTAGFGLAPAHSQTAKFIIVQSTTSTENSGLFKHILPMFTRKTGIEVRVVAVGTGHAIKNASNGDGDVLFVHAELRLWKDAGVDAKATSGTWYREAGSGMGATIKASVGMGAYVFTDRATWSRFKNRSDYKIVVEGDNKLFNQYGIILVNPAKHPNVKKSEGQAFIDWVLSPEGQNAIKSFQINGEQQFFPNADPGQMKKPG
jgi:ABC-type tungstate transport system permease subunit